MINVLIVEDDPMARKLFELIVEQNENYHLEKSIESASLAEFYCTTMPINLVLMDICTTANCDGLSASKKIKEKYPEIKIIVVTSQPECSFIDTARRYGVDSFWYKDADSKVIIDIMNRTMNGEHIYPSVYPVIKIGKALSTDFTDREKEVLRELVKGETDQAIADKLFVSLRTVKTHIQNMRDKTGFRNRTELAVRVRESGLIISKYNEPINYKEEVKLY